MLHLAMSFLNELHDVVFDWNKKRVEKSICTPKTIRSVLFEDVCKIILKILGTYRWWIGDSRTADDVVLLEFRLEVKASWPCWEFGCPREFIGWVALWGRGLIDTDADALWLDCLIPVDLGDAPLSTIAGTVWTLAAFLAAADRLVRWWCKVCCCISSGGRMAEVGVDFFERRFRLGLPIPTRETMVELWREGLLKLYHINVYIYLLL